MAADKLGTVRALATWMREEGVEHAKLADGTELTLGPKPREGERTKKSPEEIAQENRVRVHSTMFAGSNHRPILRLPPGVAPKAAG